MDCPEEVAVVRKALEPMAGVRGFVTDLSTGIATVTVDAAGPTSEQLAAAIRSHGLGSEPVGADGPRPETWWSRHGRATLTIVAGTLIGLGLSLHAAATGLANALGDAGMPVTARLAYGVAIVLSVGPILPRAWGALRSRRLDMNVLMVIAVIGAVGLGDWFEAATVSTLFALSLVLETWTARRAIGAIAALLGSTPTTARIREADGTERDVPVVAIPVGARVIVKPGDTIPVDGRIAAGTTSINQAPITGESLPVTATIGAEVFAGCVNGDGAIEITASTQAGDTLLARIARLVTESQAKRGGTERWLDRFAGIYTPLMLVLAVLIAVLPPLVTGQWSWWFYQALVLLVIACPCALVISIPVCIVAGIATAARQGVIVKGGAALEMAARVRAVAFDKTGTLTAGRPQVVAVKTVGNADECTVLELAVTLESRSEHPVAKAVLAHAVDARVTAGPADDVRAVPGRGVESPATGAWAGSLTWAEERGAMTDDARIRVASLATLGATILAIGNRAGVIGFIACQDRQRPETIAALADLRRIGISRLVMLSGDAEPVVKKVAADLHITEAHGGLLPAAKVEHIATLVSDQTPLAMVGDGLNDAPALARANLGVAMGEGTAATLETADVALLSNDLRRLPWLFLHARRVLGVMRQNVSASLIIKVIFIAAALAGHGSLWAAIAADTGVALLVVLNALRLLRPSTVLSELHP
jgi:Cd2+/Zn2+-exporting ATPase